MGVRINGQVIQKDKFGVFHSLICEFGGTYTCNPIISSDDVIVYYEFSDVSKYNEFLQAWFSQTQDVVEIRKDQWWRVLLRRLGFKYA